MQTSKHNFQLSNRYLILVGSILIFILWIYFFWDYSIDDAFITFRYAEHLADGHGFVFNLIDKPVEGFSNILWLLILSCCYKIGLPTYLSAKVLGLGAMFASGLSWYFYYLNKKDSNLWLVAPLFFCCPLVVFWGVSGLELGLHCLLLSTMIQFGLKNSKWVYLPAMLLVLNRPEGIAISFALFIILALSDYSNKKLQFRYYIVGIVILLITFSLLTWFRYATFGYPLPNTYYAKSHYNNYGYSELFSMLLRLAPLTIALLYGLFDSLKNRFKQKEITLFVGLFLLQALVSSSVDPVMNYMFRYLVAFLPLLILLAIYLLSQIKLPLIRYVILATILVSFVTFAFPLQTINETNRKIIQAQENFISWLNQAPTTKTFSMIDMGRIPYYTSHTFNDTWGLVDADIGQKGFNPIFEFLQLPDFFVFVGHLNKDGSLKLKFGRDKMIVATPAFLQCYELEKALAPEGADIYSDGYYYLAFKKKREANSIVNNLGVEFWQQKMLGK